MTKIKVGIIGCGRIAQRHAGHVQRLGQLVAAYDILPERAQNLTASFGGTAYAELKDYLGADMDIVAVCSPNGLHATHTIAALQAGYHVLCEKPMAICVSDAEEMILNAEKSDKKLFVVKQNRYNPAVVIVKELLEKHALGRIFSVQLNCFWNRNEQYYSQSDWKGSRKMDGGTLFTQFSHFIDLLYWMLGDVESVQGFAGNYNHHDIIDFEDTGVITLKFRKGTLGTINYTVNAYNKNMEGSITLFGEKGTVKIGGQYLNKLEYQEMAGEAIGELPPGNPANEYGEYQGSMSNHDRVYENVIDSLLNEAPIATTGLEGLKTVRIIENIYQTLTYVE